MKITLSLLFAAAILVSCDKETPEPSPAPSNPTSSANHFMLDGQEYNVNQDDSAMYWPAGNITVCIADNPGVFMSLEFPGQDTGLFHVVGNHPNMPNTLNVSGVVYSRADIWIHVTRYDSVGGRVQGSFEGTFKQNSDTTVVLTASGAFDLTRIQDL